MSEKTKILHTVVIDWKDGVTDQTLGEIASVFAQLRGELRGVVSFEYGSDAGLLDGNGDYAIVAVFDDLTAFQAYAGHELHVKALTELLLPNAERHMGAQVLV